MTDLNSRSQIRRLVTQSQELVIKEIEGLKAENERLRKLVRKGAYELNNLHALFKGGYAMDFSEAHKIHDELLAALEGK